MNRSLANLKNGCFEQALEDAGGLTIEATKSKKGLYRAARSMYELNSFHESHTIYTTLLAEYPDCDAAKKELRRTEDRLREQDLGVFDFLAMQKAAAEKTPPCLDIATYDRPVEIRLTENHGRGLFSTKDVAAGDLLLCEKAFSYSFLGNSSQTSLMNGSTLGGTQLALVTPTIHRVLQNPSLIPTLMSLYHGNYEPAKQTTVDGMPVIDTYAALTLLPLQPPAPS